MTRLVLVSAAKTLFVFFLTLAALCAISVDHVESAPEGQR